MRALLPLLALLQAPPSPACSIFASPSDAEVAHNVDWYDRFPNVKGAFFLNPAGLHKHGMIYDDSVKTAEWTSHLRSLTFSIAGVEFPVSGFNERGLVMGILMYSAAQYPPDSDSRPPLSPTQLVQYNLDLSSSIDDVVASTKAVRPTSKMIKMHYFACDKTRQCVVIQYDGGDAKIYTGGDLKFPVLTNSPYPASRDKASACEKAKSCDDKSDLSLWRFAEAAHDRGQIKRGQQFAEGAFPILDTIAQKDKGISTRFRFVYDPTKKRIIVKTGAGYASVSNDLRSIPCSAVHRKMIALDSGSSGNLTNWQDLTGDIQNDMALSMGLPAEMAKQTAEYPFNKLNCE